MTITKRRTCSVRNKKRVKTGKRKIKRKKQKKKAEKPYVGSFIRQPAKTRSGTRYSGKVTAKCTAEGKLDCTDKRLLWPSKAKLSLQSADGQCSCKQCTETRKKEELKSGSKSEDNIIHTNDERAPGRETQSSANLKASAASCSYRKKKLAPIKKKKDAKSVKINQYCNCDECTGTDATKKKTKRKFNKNKQYQKRTKKNKKSSRSSPQLRNNSQWLLLRKKKRSQKSKSLLKYVLKKGKEEDTARGSHDCICCAKCMEILVNYIKEQLAKQKGKTKEKKKRTSDTSVKRNKSSGKKRNRYQLRRYKSDTSMPRVSSGIVQSQNLKVVQSSFDNSLSLIKSRFKCTYVVKFKRLKNSATRKTTKSKSEKVTQKQKVNLEPPSKCLQIKKSEKAITSKQFGKKPVRRKMGHKKKMTRSKWKLLSAAVIKKLKKQIGERLVSNEVDKKKKQVTFEVPMPRAGRRCLAEKCIRKASSRGKNSTCSMECRWPSLNRETMDKQFQTIGMKSFPDCPVPSGRVPTYIAMVKTAVRDLKPFALTGKDAISKYIQIRYNMRNDDLLTYVLKWMCEMGVLRKREGQYNFSGKRLVKKETVAVLKQCRRDAVKSFLCEDARPCERPIGCRAPRTCKSPPSSCRTPRRYCKAPPRPCNAPCRPPRSCNAPCRPPRSCNAPCRPPRACNAPCRPPRPCNAPRRPPPGCCRAPRYCKSPPRPCRRKPVCRKTCCKKRCPKGRKPCLKNKIPGCTCTKELGAVKNRIKVKTRYVRNNGKIYKQEEFV